MAVAGTPDGGPEHGRFTRTVLTLWASRFMTPIRYVFGDRAPTYPAVSRRGQFLYMCFVTVIGGIVVSTLQAHIVQNHIPAVYWYIWTALVIVSAVCAFDLIVELVLRGLGLEPKVADTRWTARRDRYGHLLIQAGVIGNIFSLFEVVEHTGGLRSPLTPLLAAPAIFGAFVAQTVRGVIILVVGAGGAIVIMDEALFHRVSDATWYAYCVPQVALLFSAGVISAAVLVRDIQTRGIAPTKVKRRSSRR